MTDHTLTLAEVFGPTLQGEGPFSGRPATFVRFSGCNLSCSWCDTPYTWDGQRFDLRTERTVVAADWVAEVVAATDPRIVVLTGGEPLLQQDRPGWAVLLGSLTANGRELHLETNGTIAPNALTLGFFKAMMVSPKLDNAGPHRGHQDPAMHPAWVAEARTDRRIILKMVCQTPDEVREVAESAAEIGWPPGQVWVMPEGQTAVELAERWPAIANAAARLNVNASHRLHVLAWGAERGH